MIALLALQLLLQEFLAFCEMAKHIYCSCKRFSNAATAPLRVAPYEIHGNTTLVDSDAGAKQEPPYEPETNFGVVLQFSSRDNAPPFQTGTHSAKSKVMKGALRAECLYVCSAFWPDVLRESSTHTPKTLHILPPLFEEVSSMRTEIAKPRPRPIYATNSSSDADSQTICRDSDLKYRVEK
jgi:hypothetical protein